MFAADNTKDGATKSPLILDANQWQNIVKRLRPEAETLARQEKEREYDEYLKNGSRSMTKNWTNSVEKIRERKTQEFLRAKEQKKADGKWHVTRMAGEKRFNLWFSCFDF